MKAINHLESLIRIGFCKSDQIRKRIYNTAYQKEIEESISFHLDELDKEGVPYTIQNQALMFVNEGNEQEVWETFFRYMFSDLATRIYNGAHFNELIK